MDEAALAELKVMLDLYPARRREIVRQVAVRNLKDARRNGYAAADCQAWSFARPCRHVGYGALLLGLSKLPVTRRKSQAKVISAIFGPKTARWGCTMWNGLVAGGLVHKSKDTRAWEVTPFGKLYAQEML